MRLLYLPNENREGDQSGVRSAFHCLTLEGALEAVQSVALDAEAASTSAATALRLMLEQAVELEPHAILWQHVSSFPISEGVVSELLSLKVEPGPCLSRRRRLGALVQADNARHADSHSAGGRCFPIWTWLPEQ